MGLSTAAAAVLACACGQQPSAVASQRPAPKATAAGSKRPTYPALVRLGVTLPFIGLDSDSAQNLRDGVLMAIDEINAAGGIAKTIKVEHWIQEEGTVTSDGDDIQRASFDLRQFLTDPSVLAVLGGYSSNAVEGMLTTQVHTADPLPIVTPSATSPTISDPREAALYRPGGKPYLFRTVTTDAYQGPAMANFAAGKGLRSVYVLSEKGSVYGDTVSQSFGQQAKAKGIQVLGSVELDPALLDYTDVLASINKLRAAGLYYGGSSGPWLKVLAQQSQLTGKPVLMSADGVYDPGGVRALGGAADGWYVSISTRYVLDEPGTAQWAQKFQAKFGVNPTHSGIDEYTVNAYTGTQVLANAADRLVAAGQPLTRANLRTAIQQTHLNTIQGTIAFDANGDLTDHTVSILQVTGGRFGVVKMMPAAA
ncbi:MAG TPA: branched-chain amino acid ABC transporter substrate-binding protein [Chloroflexota bacterium]|nr:branched-chain amino acid ABC transporter substrate-binding protein [Chloroflexota bacterium]